MAGSCAQPAHRWRRAASLLLAITVSLLLAAGSASAAVVEERIVSIRVDGGSFVRDDALTVRLDESGDLDTWSEYAIALDANTELLSCDAKVLSASGTVESSVPMRRHRKVESTGFGLYSSSWESVIAFPPLRVGQRLRIRYSRREKPLFPAFSIDLVMSSRQEHVQVVVDAGSQHLRVKLSPPDPQFTLGDGVGGLTVEGSDVPAWDPPDDAPPEDLASTTLLVGWGPADDWSAVGAWYDRLSTLPPRGGQVSELARSICPPGGDRRECLEALARYVKTRVRYVAVEIAEGQWVPTPPQDVLARRWGDCKDKAQLLRALLDAVGIGSHLVLIRAGAAGEVDADFPWPFSFNHCILVLPEAAVPLRPDDPVAAGYLWVDATSELGGVGWLTTADQARPALVVAGEMSALVRSPERPNQEYRELLLLGRIESDGSLVAGAQLRLEGARAEGWIRDLRSEPDDRIAESVTAYLQSVVPGARVSGIAWSPTESVVPGFVIQAQVVAPAVARGVEGRRAVAPVALVAAPEPRILDDREVPVVLQLGIHHTRWEVTLPEGWCAPVPMDEQVENGVGRFSLRISGGEGGGLVYDRTIEIDRVLVGPDEFDELKALAVAENRAAKRRIRLRCQ